MFEYDNNAKHAAEILDKHDLSEWIKLCLFFGVRDPFSIIAHTNSWFNDPEIEEALAALEIYEFMGYLTARYDVIFDEEPTRYRMRAR